jgi:hypothetical protein
MVHVSKHLSTLDKDSAHFIGTASDQVWSDGEGLKPFKHITPFQNNERAIGHQSAFVRVTLGKRDLQSLTGT